MSTCDSCRANRFCDLRDVGYPEEMDGCLGYVPPERMCHMNRRPGTINGSIGYLTCSFCSCGFDYTEEPFHCMNCGAKVVDDESDKR